MAEAPPHSQLGETGTLRASQASTDMGCAPGPSLTLISDSTGQQGKGQKTQSRHSPGIRQFGAFHKVHALFLHDVFRNPRTKMFLLWEKGTLRPRASRATLCGGPGPEALLDIYTWDKPHGSFLGEVGPEPSPTTTPPRRGSWVWTQEGGSLWNHFFLAQLEFHSSLQFICQHGLS